MCAPSEASIAVANIAINGLNTEAASKSLQYIETLLQPAKEEISKTLLEAFATQIVFFYVIFLIVIVIGIIWYCLLIQCRTLYIVIFVLLAVVACAVSLLVTILYAKKVLSAYVNELLSSVTESDLSSLKTTLEEVFNSAALVYVTQVNSL